ncbi:MAG TPA: (d)CMP kinase [Papillibacter sp.]|jgi:cytidylate kinase|nr:(d)CMP kinase [Papillibacter sp.]
MEERSIAIDGPAGAGKSTLARMVAGHFGLIYVDTGALYRTVGLYVLESGRDTKDAAAVTEMLHTIKIDMHFDADRRQRMTLNGRDVTDLIRTPQASLAAADVSAMPPVRAFLLSMQREMAIRYDIVMDGRDIGTVVLPKAGLKVFITASPEARAQRRFKELVAKNVPATYEEVLRDILLRDKSDTEREVSPLKVAEGAVVLDTTEKSLEECFLWLCKIIEERFGL